MSATTGGPSGHPTQEIPVVDSDDKPSEVTTSEAKQGWVTRLGHSIAQIRPKRGSRGPSGTRRRDSLSAEIARDSELVKRYARLLQITVVFANMQGGASKSISAIHSGAVHATATNRPTFLMPVSLAHLTSSVADYTAVPLKEALTVSMFNDRLGELGSLEKVSPFLPTTPDGLFFLIEDPSGSGFTTQKFLDNLHQSRPWFNTIILDTGNDNVETGSMVLAAVEEADVVVFTATADRILTLRKLSKTIAEYTRQRSRREAIPAAEGVIRRQIEIPTREKASNSIALVSAVGKRKGLLRRRTKPEAFEKFTSRRDPETGSFQTVGFQGTFMTIPYEPKMEALLDAQQPVNTQYISKKAFSAYLKLWVNVYRKAAELRGVDLDKLDLPTVELANQAAALLTLEEDRPQPRSPFQIGSDSVNRDPAPIASSRADETVAS